MNDFFRVKKQLDISKPLNNTLSGSWNKIQTVLSWSNLTSHFSSNNSSMFVGNKLKSQEVYEDFSKFINPDTVVLTQRGRITWDKVTLQDDINHSWENIIGFFARTGKMYYSDDGYWLVSQDAYEFLKKYIGKQNLTIRYVADEGKNTFPYEEFARDRIILNDQVEIINQANNSQEIEQLNQQITQLQKNNQELQKQLQAAMNELMGVYQVEEQAQALQVQGNLPLPGGNK